MSEPPKVELSSENLEELEQFTDEELRLSEQELGGISTEELLRRLHELAVGHSRRSHG